MSDLTFEQMLEESFKTIHAGEVVEGTVIDVKPDEIVLNIGYKSDGILTRNEYTNEPNVDLTTVAKVGDKMEVKILKVNDGEGQVSLTYKRLAAEKGNKRIEDAFNTQEILTAKVTQVLDGGICVVVDEVRIFIPASLVSDVYEKDLAKYAGQEISFVVTEYNPKRRRYIGNRKVLLGLYSVTTKLISCPAYLERSFSYTSETRLAGMKILTSSTTTQIPPSNT